MAIMERIMATALFIGKLKAMPGLISGLLIKNDKTQPFTKGWVKIRVFIKRSATNKIRRPKTVLIFCLFIII